MPLPIWIRSRRSPFRKRPSQEFEKAQQLGRQLGALKRVQSALEKSAGVTVMSDGKEVRRQPAESLALEASSLTSTHLQLRGLMIECNRQLRAIRSGKGMLGRLDGTAMDASKLAGDMLETLRRLKVEEKHKASSTSPNARLILRHPLPSKEQLEEIRLEIESWARESQEKREKPR